jgi:translation initiation factor IF-2
MGLTSVPDAGAEFRVVGSDREARSTSEERMATRRVEGLQAPKRGMSLEDLMRQTETVSALELPLVIKSDVQGSLEAIQQSLREIKSDKVQAKFVLSGVGNITGNDVLLAKASNAIIIGFHAGLEEGVSKMARREGVEIRLYSIIYEMIDEVRAAMVGLLAPIAKENILGQVEIRQVFSLTKRGAVAGCIVKSGKVTSKSRARLRRQGDIVYEGGVSSLKRFQNDASEVREGQECGIRLENFSNYAEGDIIEAYELQHVAQQL